SCRQSALGRDIPVIQRSGATQARRRSHSLVPAPAGGHPRRCMRHSSLSPAKARAAIETAYQIPGTSGVPPSSPETPSRERPPLSRRTPSTSLEMEPANVAAADSSPEATGLFRITGALRPIEALFRNTVEHAPIGIAFANRDGSFRHGNRAFCAMLGYELDEFLLGKSILELTHPDEIQSTQAGLERLWRGDIEYLDVEKRYLRKDGSALWVR